ncbi:hypothetical protein HG1285_06655 [Hydrogenivirga sp. 128-5-R1-1]|nr:hypothetical protein HG1285_06655 [Hydrogenivirga sp. 128-5-R1-1]
MWLDFQLHNGTLEQFKPRQRVYIGVYFQLHNGTLEQACCSAAG